MGPTMKTLLLILLSLLFASFALAKPPTPRVECAAKIVQQNRQIDVSCKSKDKLQPGEVMTIEININSDFSGPPEAV